MEPPHYNPETAIVTHSFKNWHKKQDGTIKRSIRNVLKKVGTIPTNRVKWLEDRLWELKPNSHRVYFGTIGDIIYFLDGGTKSTQEKDLERIRSKWAKIQDEELSLSG